MRGHAPNPAINPDAAAPRRLSCPLGSFQEFILNKVVYVEAFFKPVGKNVTVKVPTGETKKGLFGGEKEVTRKEEKWQQTGWSDREIDGGRLAQDIAKATAQLNSEGFDVIAVESVISGAYNYSYELKFPQGVNGGAGYGYGYGYSYTEGVTIIAKKS